MSHTVIYMRRWNSYLIHVIVDDDIFSLAFLFHSLSLSAIHYVVSCDTLR